VKRNLILYASQTGNTEKVAKALGRGFQRWGWTSTYIRLPDDHDPQKEPVGFDDYDFACVGSPVIRALPLPEVRNAMSACHRPRHRLIPGPKCGMVFCTYSGIHFGPKEAEPTLKLLELELEHLLFKVIGALAVPGSMGKLFTPDWYHGVMVDRPDADDLKRADAFVDQLMERLSSD
jgi:flavorubredoxin